MRMPRLAFFLMLVIALTIPAAGQTRTLRWSSFDVSAILDAEGALHVDEKQTIVFDGPWNGGERKFDVRDGQTLSLLSLEEIDPVTGAHTAMREGSLSSTGAFAWHTPTTLRWRARAESDPPFSNTTKIYLLRYRLSNVIVRRGDRYRLSHDFAFLQRDGAIEHFTLDLKIDPVWQPADPVTMPVVVENMPPGKTFVLTVPLTYRGNGSPGVRDLSVASNAQPSQRPLLEKLADRSTPPRVRDVLAALLLLAVLAHLVVFYRNEKRRGRFDPLIPPGQIDHNWLETHLFPHKAEVAGAAWDEKVGPVEVAALLARLELEGYLSTEVRGKEKYSLGPGVLHMKRLRAFDSLPFHERWLLEALFVGRDETDTERVATMYEKHGFDPVSGLREQLENARPWSQDKPKKGLRSSWILFGILHALCIAGSILMLIGNQSDDAGSLFGMIGFTAICLVVLLSLSRFARTGLVTTRAALLPLAGAMAFAAWQFHSLLFADGALHPITLLLLAGAAISLLRVILQDASIEGAEERLTARNVFVAARRYFQHELQKKDPALEDHWYPYLVAFGLESNVRDWSRRFARRGEESSTFEHSAFTSGDGSGSSSTAGSWSGGGGAFGGAGASGSWTSAASLMGSGVAGESSSSSGSSSDSGSSDSGSSDSSSSSGGGGGGGW